MFKAETEEELSEIDELGVPELSEAVNAYHTVTTSPEYQEYERLMVKASHDEAQALYNAEQRGEARGIARGEARGAEAERVKWKKVNKEITKENEKKDKVIEKVTKENEKVTKENEALRAEIEQLRKR